MPTLLKLNNICKTFFSDLGETFVLDHISFEVNNNEIISVLGPSGCGKSTLLNILSSLDQPTEGTIIKNAKLGYMFQKDALLPWRNIYDNVTLGLEINKNKTVENISYVNELLTKYDLINFKDHYPNEISGGMRQRVSLIRTLSMKPDLLLLDEPFSALDAQTRLSVQEDVYSIIKEEKKSALIVTHDISEAIALSDKVIVLTQRPCKIKKVIDISFSSLSPNLRRHNQDFPKYFSEIFDLLSN